MHARAMIMAMDHGTVVSFVDAKVDSTNLLPGVVVVSHARSTAQRITFFPIVASARVAQYTRARARKRVSIPICKLPVCANRLKIIDDVRLETRRAPH